jgi:hypothetical protein
MVSTSLLVLIHHEGKMGRACGMCGDEEICIQGVGGGNLKERGSLEDIHVDGNIVLKWISMMGVFGPDSSVSGLGQVRGCCEKVMNWRVV